jgi:hypothetical protein
MFDSRQLRLIDVGGRHMLHKALVVCIAAAILKNSEFKRLH